MASSWRCHPTISGRRSHPSTAPPSEHVDAEPVEAGDVHRGRAQYQGREQFLAGQVRPLVCDDLSVQKRAPRSMIVRASIASTSTTGRDS